MEIYALVGKSGTGKSTSVLHFCHEHNIPAIIDDGILIVNGHKIAGTSAKYEQNSIRAVKRATFHYEDHRQEIMNIIRMTALTKLLIVGTSKKMVDLIAEKLMLGPIQEYIDVSEIRSTKEIKLAQFMRNTQGKHVIPIPYMQVEHNKLMKIIETGKKLFSKQKTFIGEATIIQPHFTKGTVTIHENVFADLVTHICKEIDIVKHVKVADFDFIHFQGITIELQMSCTLEDNIPSLLTMIQQKVADSLLSFLDIELNDINIHLTKVKLDTSDIHNEEAVHV